MELASISEHVQKGTCDHFLGHGPAHIGELRTIPGRSLINDSLKVSRMSIFLKRGTRRQTFISISAVRLAPPRTISAKSSTRSCRNNRVLDILHRRRTMIPGHVQQFRCLL
jgi:hypothetical protein